VNSAIGSIGGRNQFAALTEYNAIYWGGGTGWSNTNDMGHALAVFDIAMQHVVLPGVAFSLLWNTRWVDNAGKQFDINDALDKDGNLNATGKALAVLGNHLLPRIKPVSGLSARVRAWAAACATGDTLNMLIVNKGPGETALTLRVDGMAYDTVFIRERLAGSGPGDTAPALTGTARGGESLTVPDASVTVVSFVKYGAVTRARTGLTGRAGSSRRAGTDVRFSDCAGRRLDAARVRQNFAGVYFVESCRTGTFHRVLRRD